MATLSSLLPGVIDSTKMDYDFKWLFGGLWAK